MKKMKASILGASGMIGQRFVQLLEDHPYFEIGGLYASERSDGKKMMDVLKLRDYDFREETLNMVIEEIDIKSVADDSKLAFSGLPSSVAGEVESGLASEGVAVFSNASSYRMRADVPLLIPEVNADHLDLVEEQNTYPDGGFIVTNANCSTTGVALPLKALHSEFGLDMVTVSTYQAISGAGYPGVASLDIVGNVLPFIGGEEEKMETEILKMLGTLNDGVIDHADFDFLANCARVPVVDGHLESMVLTLKEGAEPEDVAECLQNFQGVPQMLELPTAPENPIVVRKEQDRPQPALDSLAGSSQRTRGMAVTAGRIRKKDRYHKLFILSHNTLRGGSGGSVLNAELAWAKGRLR